MTRVDLEELLELTDTFSEVGRRPIPKVPALRGRTVATVFFENSTRTRMSFDTAARRLSADTLAFTAGGSSISKGESLRDTVEVVAAYGFDALVVRHPMAGTAHRVAGWTNASGFRDCCRCFQYGGLDQCRHGYSGYTHWFKSH